MQFMSTRILMDDFKSQSLLLQFPCLESCQRKTKQEISENYKEMGSMYVVVQFFPLVQFFLNLYRIH